MPEWVRTREQWEALKAYKRAQYAALTPEERAERNRLKRAANARRKMTDTPEIRLARRRALRELRAKLARLP